MFILSFLSVLIMAGCASDGHKAGWNKVDECVGIIQSGNHEKVIDDSKSILIHDRWNSDAHSCMIMAYYLSDKKQIAIKKLRESTDTIPKEHVDRIHDILWHNTPEFLAEREYAENFPINGGDCLLRNVKALNGNGFLIIGRFYDPKESRMIRHVMGYRCDRSGAKCSDIDMTCPECEIREPEAIIAINDYRVSDVQRLITGRPIERNLRYINKILELESGR